MHGDWAETHRTVSRKRKARHCLLILTEELPMIGLAEPLSLNFDELTGQIRALMAMLVEDGMGPGGGVPGRANLGDYAMTESEYE